MFAFCRLCANRMHETEKTAEISEMTTKLIVCCNWKLSKIESQMPQRVCRVCVDELERSWRFAEQIHLAEKKLQLHWIELNQPTMDEPEPIVEINEIEQEEDEQFSDMEVTAFSPPSIESSSESVHSQKTTKKRKKSPKKTVAKTKKNPDSFLSKLTNEGRLANGQISEHGVAKLFELFPEMKTMTWDDCQFICKKCDKVYKNPQNFYAHNRSIHTFELLSNRVSCFYCNHMFKREYLLQRHIADEHFPHLKFRCFYCNAYFWDVQELNKHRNTHKDVQYKCEICQHIVYNREILYTHVAQVHFKKNWGEFICDICGKVYATKDRIKCHMIQHTGKFDYVCDQCGSKFRQKSNLKEHMITHLTERLIACNHCDRRFKTERLLKSHLKFHENEKPLKCDECTMRFRSKHALKNHSIIHSDYYPFQCTFCDKKFKHRAVKTVHERTHTNEKPYACGQCDYKSANFGNLNKHSMRIHSIDIRIRKGCKRQDNTQNMDV